MVGVPYRSRQTNTPHQTGSRAQIQSPCLKCLRTKLLNLQTTSQPDNTRSPRDRFMAFVCESISSEQMIFLCLFKNKHSPMTDAFIIQTIQRPSGRSLRPASLPRQQVQLAAQSLRSPRAPRARVHILKTQSHIPKPAIHSHSLPVVVRTAGQEKL